MLLLHMQEIVLVDSQEGLLSSRGGGGGGADILAPGLHLLYALFTNDCQVIYDSNVLVKFADNTTVIGLIENNNEVAYREEIQNLTAWCDTNNLVLNIRKTK